jgi:hypothetical protein
MLISAFIIIAPGSFAPSIANYWRQKASDKIHHLLSRFSPCPDKTRQSSYRTQEWDPSDALHLQKVALEEYGIALWTQTKHIPLHLKVFRIPWLME